ncbi:MULTISPECIES: DUF6817 domain-containing protein [Streptomyces]|uniref:DUF6817 domain-containing protein n=1 Tax=Streptomyces TaxID=1883 RepID=UPI00167228FA|nr:MULTISPECIES: hypothetical protein [Streptomyces]MBK3523697.1 hypothetical protein [Streptomyces sp. MBT70]GGS09962.1 hypothetical protein GCM10010236_75560 [Streptomyces eurythermus]
MAPARQQSPAEKHRAAIEAFLRDRGAARMPHPGGTLLEHLRRVQQLLAEWGASPVVQTAGLCHATYGTDGFAPSLLPHTDRATLVALIGEPAEALVYLYASCDRATVYPRIDGTTVVAFRDRFTSREHRPTPSDLRAFLEITAANELDVLAHNAELARQHGPELYGFLKRVGSLLSPAAQDAVARRLA